MSENENNIYVYDGGTAFPIDENCSTPGCVGMSLRDYFAAKALSCLANTFVIGTHKGNQNKRLVAACYSVADSMLKERSK